MAKRADYFGYHRKLSMVLVIIPITALIFGVITRVKERKFLAGFLRLLLGWNIMYIVDIVCLGFSHKILRIVNI